MLKIAHRDSVLSCEARGMLILRRSRNIHPVGMMSQTETDRKLAPMIERLSEMPPGTVGFRAAGKIERKDYDDVLAPELRRALERGGGLRTLYVI